MNTVQQLIEWVEQYPNPRNNVALFSQELGEQVRQLAAAEFLYHTGFLYALEAAVGIDLARLITDGRHQ